MNKVMGRLRRGSSFKEKDIEGSSANGVAAKGKAGPVPVPSPWGGVLKTRDCSPACGSGDNSPEVPPSRWDRPPSKSCRCETPGLDGDQSVYSTPCGTPEAPPVEEKPAPRGVARINTLWGSCIQVPLMTPN